jgi:hypothetical protein
MSAVFLVPGSAVFFSVFLVPGSGFRRFLFPATGYWLLATVRSFLAIARDNGEENL